MFHRGRDGHAQPATPPTTVTFIDSLRLLSLKPATAVTCFLSVVALTDAQQLRRMAPETVGMSSERLERVDAAFERYVDEGQLPGAVVLVARNGGIVHMEAYGKIDLESGAEMKPDAIFRIASQTKALVSVGIMMLQEEGRLLVDDPLARYLPEFADTTVAEAQEDGSYEVVPAKRNITLRDLLTHTSGYGYGGGPAADKWKKAGIEGWYFADREEPVRETIRRMASLPAESHPGERFVYGYNTDILGAVIEVVSGQTLDVFLRKRIFEPLGMTDTHFYLPKDKTDRLATVYSKEQDAELVRAPDPGHMVGQGHYLEGPRVSFSGGAGLLSTARDYAIFLQMLANGGEYNGARLVSPKTVQLMTVDHLPEGVSFPWNPGTGFGLGFSVVEDMGANGLPESEGTYGWGGAYHSNYWIDPVENLVVVYFTQVIPAQGIDDHQKLRALVYQAIVESEAQVAAE